VAWSDYAFTFYCDTVTQLYPATPPQIESSMLVALGDLGFRDVEAPSHHEGESVIRAKAPDGRHVRVTISPRGTMTIVAVVVGPGLGDYQLSRELLRRIALNFGSGIRAYTPMELTLPNRINPPNPFPPRQPPDPPEALKGEGLRPDARQEAIPEEITVPGSVVPPVPGLPQGMQGFVPTMAFPNPPYVPYAPWPYYSGETP
jgi:hypothetical protein